MCFNFIKIILNLLKKIKIDGKKRISDTIFFPIFWFIWLRKIFINLKLFGPFVVLFQGHIYPCEHLEHIRGAFRLFFAEKFRNFDFYEFFLARVKKPTKRIIFVVLF